MSPMLIFSVCCSLTILSLTERMLGSEPELAWDGRVNKSTSRCALCFHFIKYKCHGGQKPPWVLAAVEVRRIATGTNSGVACGQRPAFPGWAVKAQTLNGQLYPEKPYRLSEFVQILIQWSSVQERCAPRAQVSTHNWVAPRLRHCIFLYIQSDP